MSKTIDGVTKLNDPVFGEMEYSHSWQQSQTVKWWGNANLVVKITAHAYGGEGITDQQRNSFLEYKQDIDCVINNSIPLMCDFLHFNFDIDCAKEELFDLLKPTTVLFFEAGSWGILFDSKADVEHGISLYKEGGQWKVGCQDDFL